jgi:hypothetical protein
MPQTVQISVTLTINPPAPPPPPALVATPASVTLPDETSGVAVSAVPVAVISGGTPPYLTPVIDPSSPNPLPSGMTVAIDGSGNVTWSGTPPVVSSPVTGTFIVDVTDSGA